ncbi:MAG TPA: glycosyltransferase family 2 protein [Ktedonobacteraceae bacterium]|nr:glycosyltransferase family 2 protein [Ktedonobacteraceae bacterium]
MKFEHLLVPFALAQTLLGVRVILRMIRSAGAERIQCVETWGVPEQERVSVIVPVLNEHDRLAPCLEGLLKQGPEVSEILVVDGGSQDGTQQIVQSFARRDARIHLFDSRPIPASWNGKSWGLEFGRRAGDPSANWILTLDADVRPAPGLVRALLARALRDNLHVLSVATLQELASPGLCLVHPALLATLVYRSGIPGRIARRIPEVQANGQCFLVHREALQACGGFAVAAHSLCEDITLARALVAAGYPAGFFETDDLVSVQMYTSAGEAWRNWTRSLPMRDQFSGVQALLGWLEIMLVQALPLPLFLVLLALGRRSHPVTLLNAWLAAVRIGVLCGMARAYRRRLWPYWLSPLCDLPVAIQLARKALQRRHVWRGRILLRGGNA